MNKFDILKDHVTGAFINAAIDITGGNRGRAAKILGVSRTTLQTKIEP